eukprot:TRINITY_DN1235_c1_g2_i1.p1 TRINITY_DN1235_c1_g2~~TRINITY_DN1235_c1_g2_i1.p1  ORF type:complete len:256 (+),score=48.06 TRINITY_DN1235_c1_g2_i1:39-770(+)
MLRFGREVAVRQVRTFTRSELIEHIKVLQWDINGILTERSLRRQFHKLAQKYHPDVCENGSAMMQEVNVSFTFCIEAIKRGGGSIELSSDDSNQTGRDVDADSDQLPYRIILTKMKTLQQPEDMTFVLGSLWKLAGTGELPNDPCLLEALIDVWSCVLPLGMEHSLTCLRTVEKWCSVHQCDPPLDCLHGLLERYQEAFHKHPEMRSVISPCWPLMVDFIQQHCEPTELTFLIIRRMDPTIRI